MQTNIVFWICFVAFILTMLSIDLGLFHKNKHTVSIKESLYWTFTWIALALIFNGIIYFTEGKKQAIDFLTGYLVEYSLSVDNIFVFILIFSYFNVPRKYQHKVLFWGIIGALVMRGLAIAAGSALLKEFEWVILIFGGILIYTGSKLFGEHKTEINPEKNPVLRFFRKIFPLMPRYVGDRFFVKKAGKLFATPLFFVLVVIETTDVIFAVDSIPAILGITTDTFIVFTSNVFAILGLRSLYFALSGIMQLFRFLNYGLAIILIFVGAKMISGYAAHHWFDSDFHISNTISLLVIVCVLSFSIIASMAFPEKKKEKE